MWLAIKGHALDFSIIFFACWLLYAVVRIYQTAKKVRVFEAVMDDAFGRRRKEQ